MSFWQQEVTRIQPDCAIFIVACKLDLLKDHGGIGERGVSLQLCQEYARNAGAEYFETSSKTGMNINTPFEAAAERYVYDNNDRDGLGPFKWVRNNNKYIYNVTLFPSNQS